MRWIQSLGLAVAALVITNACADDAVRGVGRMMIDAGEALGDWHARDADASMGAGGNGNSSPNNIHDGGALSDAGQMLVDAGRAMIDAGRDQARDASAETPPTAANGSRIKLRRTTNAGADGTRYVEPFLSYYDTMLDVACTPHYTTTDGKQRCVPQPGLSAVPVVARFADADCTSRLAYDAEGTCEAGAYGYESSNNVTSECGSTGREITRTAYRFYRLGAKHTGKEYAKDAQGMCKPAAAVAGNHPYLVGAEMQPNEFVEFTTTTEDLP